MLDWRELSLPEVAPIELPEFNLPPGESAERQPHQPITLYRWLDNSGGVQFGTTPPTDGIPYETLEVHPDANLIQPPVATSLPQQSQRRESSPSPSLTSPLSTSPQEAMQIMQDAREIREMSQERLRQHEALTQ